MSTEFLTLKGMLEDLKNKIDEDYADRIEKSSNPKVWDAYEAKSVEAAKTIDKVISWARQYCPELVEAELIREIVISTRSQ